MFKIFRINKILDKIKTRKVYVTATWARILGLVVLPLVAFYSIPTDVKLLDNAILKTDIYYYNKHTLLVLARAKTEFRVQNEF